MAATAALQANGSRRWQREVTRQRHPATPWCRCGCLHPTCRPCRHCHTRSRRHRQRRPWTAMPLPPATRQHHHRRRRRRPSCRPPCQTPCRRRDPLARPDSLAPSVSHFHTVAPPSRWRRCGPHSLTQQVGCNLPAVATAAIIAATAVSAATAVVGAKATSARPAPSIILVNHEAAAPSCHQLCGRGVTTARTNAPLCARRAAVT